jgi:hypothetical protein
MTWESLRLAEKEININNVIIEPTNAATSFIVYGEDKDSNGVVIAIDFDDLHNYQCKGFDIPDLDTSDYETWIPNMENYN